MHLRTLHETIEIAAPAKVNLFLEVLGRRADGYHELETLMVPIDRYDTLRFTPQAGLQLTLACDTAAIDGRVETSTPSLPSAACEQLPTGDENLVLKAVRRLRDRAGIEMGGHLHLTKRIPLAAGLAGGSSDAAAALAAANQAWRLDWPHERLAEIAAEIGSDVPFFLARGAAVCRGRGERIERCGTLGTLHFVVVKPPAGLSTAAVFKACQPASQPHGVEQLLVALRRGRLAEAGALFHNRLQSAARSISPWIDRLAMEFARLPVLGHQMSGSGTSYFGLCASATLARRVAARLRSQSLGLVWSGMSTM